MWATSSSLTVRVHEKPILRKLFPFGLTYTIYLEERGQDKKVGIQNRHNTGNNVRQHFGGQVWAIDSNSVKSNFTIV